LLYTKVIWKGQKRTAKEIQKRGRTRNAEKGSTETITTLEYRVSLSVPPSVGSWRVRYINIYIYKRKVEPHPTKCAHSVRPYKIKSRATSLNWRGFFKAQIVKKWSALQLGNPATQCLKSTASCPLDFCAGYLNIIEVCKNLQTDSAAWTLGSQVRILLEAWLFVCVFPCCVLLCRYRPCVELIPRPRSPTNCPNRFISSEVKLLNRNRPLAYTLKDDDGDD
jgi:hypothetical protein